MHCRDCKFETNQATQQNTMPLSGERGQEAAGEQAGSSASRSEDQDDPSIGGTSGIWSMTSIRLPTHHVFHAEDPHWSPPVPCNARDPLEWNAVADQNEILLPCDGAMTI